MVPILCVSLLLLLPSLVIAAFPQLHVSQDLYSGRFILADAAGREQIIKGVNLGTGCTPTQQPLTSTASVILH